jgi:hypothetical protein
VYVSPIMAKYESSFSLYECINKKVMLIITAKQIH